MGKDNNMQEYSDVVHAIQDGKLRELLDANPELINKPLFAGTTVAHLVVTLGSTEDIVCLAEKNANFNVLNDDKMSPLALATASGDLDKVKACLASGASIQVKGERQSILIEAAFSGDDKMIDELLTKGAKMQIGDQVIDKNTPHAHAVLKVAASIEESANKKDLNSFLTKIKGERKRLGNDDITQKVLDGVDDRSRRKEILESINKAQTSEQEKQSTKAALVFCWNQIDEAGAKIAEAAKENDQKKSKSKLYQIMADVYKSIATAIKAVAKCFKRELPQSAKVADEISATCSVSGGKKPVEQTRSEQRHVDNNKKFSRGGGPTGGRY